MIVGNMADLSEPGSVETLLFGISRELHCIPFGLRHGKGEYVDEVQGRNFQ